MTAAVQPIDDQSGFSVDETFEKALDPRTPEDLLEAIKPSLPLQLEFRCFGMPFTANAVDGPEGLRLILVGQLGPMPYTIESPTAREVAKAVIAREPACSMARITLTDEQRVVVVGEVTMEAPVTSARIVATATAILACSKPLIDLMKSCLSVGEFRLRAA